jgi:hypothetical protein
LNCAFLAITISGDGLCAVTSANREIDAASFPAHTRRMAKKPGAASAPDGGRAQALAVRKLVASPA